MGLNQCFRFLFALFFLLPPPQLGLFIIMFPPTHTHMWLKIVTTMQVGNKMSELKAKQEHSIMLLTYIYFIISGLKTPCQQQNTD